MVLSCHCGASRVLATGKAVLHAYCHSQVCRELFGGAVVAVTMWRGADLSLAPGARAAGCFVQPLLEATRHFCAGCGSTLFLVDALGLRVVSHALIAASYRGILPAQHAPTMHLHYAQRQLDIDDELPKHLERPGGPQYQPRPPVAPLAVTTPFVERRYAMPAAPRRSGFSGPSSETA